MSSPSYKTKSWSHSLNCFWPSGHICVCFPGNLLLFELSLSAGRAFHLIFSCLGTVTCLQLWKATLSPLNTETWKSEKEMLLYFSNTPPKFLWSYLLGLYTIVIVSFQMHQFLLPAWWQFKKETSAKFWYMISYSFHSLKEHMHSNLAGVHPLPVWFLSFTWTLEVASIHEEKHL